MKKNQVTIHDIAKKLNTSASTVSRALQDHPRISEATKNAVKKMALELNYYPNSIASSLRKGKGNTLGVIIPQIDRHFFSTVLRGIDEIATAFGYNVIICQSYESIEKESVIIKNLLGRKIDGLIISVSLETKTYKHFELALSRNIPIVFFDRVIEELNVSKVLVDDFIGGFNAVEHLITMGCKKIAHFAGPEHINIYRDRTRGYLKALNKHNIAIDESIILQNVITQEKGFEAMLNLIKSKNVPDAIFSSGDFSALGAILCAMENGYSIPGDIAFVGFANEPFDAFVSIPLSSIDQHGREMGQQATKIILEEIAANKEPVIPRKIVLTPDLVIRKSSLKKQKAGI